MKEIAGMVQCLLEMRTDTYMMCKYTLLAVSMGHHGTHEFMEKLFSLADRKRPLLIGMKKGGAA